MEDNLNQDLTAVEGLFDDYESESGSEDVEKVEEPKVEEPKAEEPKVAETEPTPESFLDITYNKETKSLSKEEAKTLAQKGMNYDKMLERYAPIEELARLNGMDVTTFINSLNETQRQFEVDKELNSLKQQFPNTDEAVLKELAQSRAEGRVAKQLEEFKTKQNEQANAQEQQVLKDLELFKKEFPDVDYTNLPEEVYSNVRNGLPLLSAYYKYLRTKESAEQKVDKINETNKEKSLGSTTNAGGGIKDAFLEGFNSF